MRTLQLAPRAIAAELERYVDVYYPAYRDGHLLVSGGWAEQPARYVALIQQIQRLERQAQAKHDEVTAEDGEEA